MAPKIVKKDQRRKELALLSYEYLLVSGVENFSTAGLIKHLNIGKSSLYNYFESRDEILTEIYFEVSKDFFIELKNIIKEKSSLKEKLLCYMDFYTNNSVESLASRDLYVEYLGLNKKTMTKYMKEIYAKIYKMTQEILEEAIKDEIQKGNIKKQSLQMVNSIISTCDGMLIYSQSMDGFDLKKELLNYVDTFILLVKEEK